MNRLVNNEILGLLALQTALANAERQSLQMSKAFLVLPLLFNARIRSALKRKNSAVIGVSDLIATIPSFVISFNARFSNLLCVSLNTVIVAHEVGMVDLHDQEISLLRPAFVKTDAKTLGKIGADIHLCGPRLKLLLNENSADLYRKLGIQL